MKGPTQGIGEGQLYEASSGPDVLRFRWTARCLLHQVNLLPPQADAEKAQILREFLGRIGPYFVIEDPLHCDYGFNIEIGNDFYANVDLVILDCARVLIGDNVFVGPNGGIYTSGHPLDAERRNAGLEYALPITTGNNVWIGGSPGILPGVTIPDGAVIGSGANVTRDVPEHVLWRGQSSADHPQHH